MHESAIPGWRLRRGYILLQIHIFHHAGRKSGTISDERTQSSFAELDALARLAAGEQNVFVDLTPHSEASSGAPIGAHRPSEVQATRLKISFSRPRSRRKAQ